MEAGQFTFGPPPRPSFFPARPVADRLGERVDSRESSRGSRSRQLGSTPLERDEAYSSTPPRAGQQEESRRPWRNEQSCELP